MNALIIGVGLIGGSIGLRLRAMGWHVVGRDSDEVLNDALAVGAIDEIAPDGFLSGIDLTFVATPVGKLPAAIAQALVDTDGIVTDVGSVKANLLPLFADARVVGGHPMAGSEQEGVRGARAELFEGRTWVLTPIAETDNDALALVRSVVSDFGAEVVSLPPDRHDSMVAVVSHVPHLTAASLMSLADDRSSEHRGLLRLAAGGFRDMTRIASGHPGIWPDICAENRTAIVAELDRLLEQLSTLRTIVAEENRDELLEVLERARLARMALPARFTKPSELVEVRIPVEDRPGALASITMLSTELDVSIADIEIAHSVEGDEGVVILLVEAVNGERLEQALRANDYRPVVRPLDGQRP